MELTSNNVVALEVCAFQTEDCVKRRIEHGADRGWCASPYHEHTKAIKSTLRCRSPRRPREMRLATGWDSTATP